MPEDIEPAVPITNIIYGTGESVITLLVGLPQIRLVINKEQEIQLTNF